ncbi:hypothetical protein D0867_06127, partial [Hortaea werneckii]
TRRWQIAASYLCLCAFSAAPIVGPTLGFIVGVCMAIICWPAALLCCCCATDAGKRYVFERAASNPVQYEISDLVVKNVRNSRRYVRSDKQCDTLLATTTL